MSENKWVPGPWTLGVSQLGVDMSCHVPINAPRHMAFAQVVWVMDTDQSLNRRSPRCEANAHLIATAPELYDTLELAEKELRLHNLSSVGEQLPNTPIARVLERIQATKAKARGES